MKKVIDIKIINKRKTLVLVIDLKTKISYWTTKKFFIKDLKKGEKFINSDKVLKS